MRRLLLALSFILMGMQAGDKAQDQYSPQEAYFLRKMTELWKDRDYRLVKVEVEEFLKTHPASAIHEPLQAILADILYHDKSYDQALAIYQKITDPALLQKTKLRKCQCLYLTGHYDTVIAELAGTSDSDADEMKFIFADSLFRKMQGVSDGQKQALAQKAKPFLLSLYSTSYKTKVLYPLAEVRRILGDSAEAAALFLQLADEFPEKKEEILLQAAALLMNINKSEAITTYQRVVDLGQGKAPDAAYNELVLLFHEDRFQELVARERILGERLKEDKQPLYNFCMGRSHFKLDHFKEAAVYLEKFIWQEKENTPYKRAAYLTVITCAQQEKDSPLFEKSIEEFVAAFPQDLEAGKALLLRAQAALKEDKNEQAVADLGRLLTAFADFPERETLLFNYALLLSKVKKWSDSRKTFLAFIDAYPQSQHLGAVWPSMLQCSTEELKKASPEEILAKKSQLAHDLQEVMGKSNDWSCDERAGYQFLLGQLLYDVKEWKASLSALETYVTTYPEHPSRSQALLMVAYLHRELGSEATIFVQAAEEALVVAEEASNKTALRLQLFNSYLSLKNFDKAAEHLYQVAMVDKVFVNEENTLWLAHHFAAKQDKRVFELLREILKYDDNFALHFDPEKTYLEAEVMKLAELIMPTERKKLLLSLREMQQMHPGHSWKLQRQVAYELAKIHLTEGETDEALKIFEELAASAELTPSYYSNAAILEKNRILLSRCAACDRTDANPEIAHILSTLKDLQIQKRLACEPLHLEAALEYADLRASLVPAESKTETALFFLQRIQEDFTANDDTIRQEYHEARLRFPEKDTLFQTYMKCVKAEILALQAKMSGDQDVSLRALSEASSLFEEVLRETSATPFLKKRAEAYLTNPR